MTITTAEVLQHLIDLEKELHFPYQQVQSKPVSPHLKNLLLSIKDQEIEHIQLLEEMLQAPDRDSLLLPEKLQLLAMEKAAALGRKLDNPTHGELLSTIILVKAMLARLYTTLAESAREEDIRVLFRQLALEADRCQQWASDRFDLEEM